MISINSKNLCECILSGTLEFSQNTEEFDHRSQYIYKFYDAVDLNLQMKFGTKGNEDFWYPFTNDPKEVYIFETTFQDILQTRSSKTLFL